MCWETRHKWRFWGWVLAMISFEDVERWVLQIPRIWNLIYSHEIDPQHFPYALAVENMDVDFNWHRQRDNHSWTTLFFDLISPDFLWTLIECLKCTSFFWDIQYLHCETSNRAWDLVEMLYNLENTFGSGISRFQIPFPSICMKVIQVENSWCSCISRVMEKTLGSWIWSHQITSIKWRKYKATFGMFSKKNQTWKAGTMRHRKLLKPSVVAVAWQGFSPLNKPPQHPKILFEMLEVKVKKASNIGNHEHEQDAHRTIIELGLVNSWKTWIWDQSIEKHANEILVVFKQNGRSHSNQFGKKQPGPIISNWISEPR